MNPEILLKFEARLRATSKRLAMLRARIAMSSHLMQKAPELERTILHRLRFISLRRRKVRALLKVVEWLSQSEVALLLGVDPGGNTTETQAEIVRAVRLARCVKD
ncbi:MAG: hypothetical protein L6Q38_03315 [Nitrospira sp.]|nr:hypothetical protein [Nitrospira sp.]